MIAWMAGALLAALLVAGAALAMEEVARLLRRPVRWIWVAAMMTAVGLPFLSRLLPAPAPVPVAAFGTLDVEALQALLSTAEVVDGSTRTLRAFLRGSAADPWLTSAWIAVGGLMLLTLLLTHHRLRRVRAAGRPARIADVPVLVTRATGPMVVGLRRPQIVVPEWVDELSPEEQQLILRHEAEHARAGDTRLLTLGALLLAAMPWNLPVWWMRHRLRQAIEVDCDARVLAAGADRRLYGTMLIRTAGRPRPAPLIAPALVELPSLLERRILAMTRRTPAHPRLRLGTAALLAALFVVAACELSPRGSSPSPTEPTLAEVLDVEDPAPGQDAASVVAARRMLDNVHRINATLITEAGDTVPAGSFGIRIADDGTFSTGAGRPVVLVDGERVASMASVDPQRIASVEVLKGEAALAAFGPEASDGLIRVTTGEPRRGATASVRPAAAPRVDFSVEEVAVTEHAVTAAPAAAPQAVRVVGYATADAAEAPVAVEDVAAVGYGTARRAEAPQRVEGATAIGYGTAARAAAPVTVGPEPVSVRSEASTLTAEGIRIRGVAATDGEPLILVDGEVIPSLAELRERIPPNTIASITVLKDESATSLYGARGRNGVILVELKK